MATSKPMQSAQEKRWEIEDAIRTLQRAEDIRSNAKLMSDVKSSITKLQKVVTSSPKKK
jgi:hypothetical protein